jgi:putative ABC transport system permease protein
MDLRRVFRTMRQAPGTTTAVVLTIALATGFTDAAAAAVYGILLRPLPYRDAAQLVTFDHAVPRLEIDDWRARLRTVDGLAGSASADHAVRGLGRARILRVAFVSPSFFPTMNPPVIAGRLPATADQAAVVISERVLREQGLDAESAPGTVITAVNRTFTIAGVVSTGMAVPEEITDLWLPADAAEAVAMVRSDDRRFRLTARLRPGVSLTQVNDDATRVRRELWTGDAAERGRLRVTATSLEQDARGASTGALVAFLVGGLLTVLVACANIASLLLSRTMTRERELAICFALGAGTRRVAMSLFAEGLVLSLLGSTLGACLSVAGVEVLRSASSSTITRVGEVRADLPVLAFCAAISLVIATLCTVGPTWYVLRHGVAPLVRPTSGGQAGARRLQSMLAGTQLAISIVVLVAAVLLSRTMVNLLNVPIGVRQEGVLTARVMLGERTLLTPGEGRAFADALVSDVARLPGVRHVAFGSSLPPATSIVEMAIRVVEGGRDETLMMALVAATPGWADALGIRLIEGRFLRAEDSHANEPGVVVSRSVARHFFRDRPAVGLLVPSAIPGSRGRKARVVGVVEDVRYAGLLAPAGGAIYVPWEALPFGVVRLVVRTSGDPLSLAGPIGAIARRLDASRPMEDVRPLDDVVLSSVAERRVYALIATSLGLTAFSVAIVGLVATLARVVTVRRREFAIRVAIGATPSRLARRLLQHASIVILPGVLVGTLLAWTAARGLASYLYGVSATGIDTYAAVAALVVLVALLSCVWPVWRALTISPTHLLRSDA